MVSVVVPCFNHEKYIDFLIDSLLAQSFDNAEIFMCDDCSSDETWHRLLNRKKELDKKFCKVVYLRHDTNKGITATLNEMIRGASGEWIKPIASDDMLDRDYLRKINNLYLNNPDVGIIISNGYYTDESEIFPPNVSSGKIRYQTEPDFSGDGLFARLFLDNYIFATGASIRKNVYDSIGLYDETILIEDWEFWLRASNKGVKFLYENDTLCYYRRNPSSITSLEKTANMESRILKLFEAEMSIIEKYRKDISKEVFSDRKLLTIDNYYWISRRNGLTNALKKIQKEIINFSLIIDVGLVKYLRYLKNTFLRVAPDNRTEV